MVGVAQDGIKLKVLTPPPPEVSALGKFGLMPVDNFTGVPSIAIPIYTIKEGTLDFPVSLQYHAGGIKVKEEASEVGLGWALSAGGSVVSVTRGHPDFPAGFVNHHISMPDPPAMQQGIKDAAYSVNNWYYQYWNEADIYGSIASGLTLSHNGVAKQYFNQFTVGYDGDAPDFTSDLYMITIGDRSYKFIFDNDFKPVLLGDGSVKIEMISDGNFPNWKVTDEAGVAYYFERKQFYYSNNFSPANSGTAPQLNTWHLTRIISPTYGKIDFSYLYSATEFMEPVPTESEIYLVGNISPHTQQQRVKYDAYYTMYQRLNIDKIQFSSGYLQFIYDDNRLDLKGGRRLQAIEVRDKDQRLVKKTVFDNNDYFTASGDDMGFYSLNVYGFTPEHRTKRLKLKAVLETDVTDPNNVRKYTFTYNEYQNLPSKLSLGIDHWGYSNGAGNSTLIPPVTLTLTGQTTTQEFTGANREANPSNMQANILTAIQYPTGGISNFTYEANQFYRTETLITWHNESSGMFKAAGSSEINTSGFIDANGNFTVLPAWVGKKLAINSIVSNPSNPASMDMDIIVRRNGFFVKRISTIPPAGQFMVIDSSIILEAGNYNISYEASTNFFNSFEIRRTVYVVRAYSTSEDVIKTVYSGGLRTSKIRNVDPVTGNVNTKTFTYYNGSEDNMPVYESAEGQDWWGTSETDYSSYFRYRYGQSIYPFSDGRMAPSFGYEKVEVREVDSKNNSNGVSEYNYSTSGSLNINTMLRYNPSLYQMKITNPVVASIPDMPSGDRGKLMSEKHYKLVNGAPVPVSSTEYRYTRDNSTTIWQMLFNQGLSTMYVNGGQSFRIYAHHFHIPVLRNMLRRKESSEYDDLGNVTMNKYEEYAYDNVNGHYQLIKKTTGNSRGDQVNEYFKYPQDYGDLTNASNLDPESQGIKLLQQAHVVTPVETYNEQVKATSGDKKYTGAQITVFNNNLPTPKQLFVLEKSTPLTAFTPAAVTNGAFSKNSLYASRIRYTQYDANGKLLEQNKENDMLHSYIWDYDAMLPVAEVVNAPQSDIAFTSFEAGGTGNWSGINAANVQNSGGITGSKYYSQNGFSIIKSSLNASTAYVVSYWTLNNSAYTIAGTQVNWPKKIRSAVINGNTWNCYQHLVSGQSAITLTGSGSIDELRLMPQNAKMATYTYDPLVGVTTQSDQNNRITYYEYDGFNRLTLVKDQDGNILKTFDYHYKQ
jgi:YD repeat-containing protein